MTKVSLIGSSAFVQGRGTFYSILSRYLNLANFPGCSFICWALLFATLRVHIFHSNDYQVQLGLTVLANKPTCSVETLVQSVNMENLLSDTINAIETS